jgi:hypothetical protein
VSPRRHVYPCANCGLPDLHNGDGDGIGSCECPRCEDCGGPPGLCSCDEDAAYYDGWPDDEETPVLRPVAVTVRTILDGEAVSGA